MKKLNSRWTTNAARRHPGNAPQAEKTLLAHAESIRTAAGNEPPNRWWRGARINKPA